MKRWLLVVLVALGVGFWLGRQTLEEVTELVFPTTPHEAYAESLEQAGLDATALGRAWLRAAEESVRGARPVPTPFHETGYLDPAGAEVVAYRFDVRAGRRLHLELDLEPPSDARVFIDLFRLASDPGEAPVHVLSADSGQHSLEYEPRRDGAYILRIQPELLRGGGYTLAVGAAPTLSFPVQGRDPGSIRSFWGDPRDGGSRSHHGVDIFAPRGTPVVAATTGRVSRVRETRIGGRVVWLRDEQRSQSLYYAHLDRQLVEPGQQVQPGDTLGLVGNSGNARSTPTHLHFGIYRRGMGPLDPLPFLAPAPPMPPAPTVAEGTLGAYRRVAADETRLRAGPDPDAPIMDELHRDLPVRVLGAVGDWFRVRLPDGRAGFLAARLTEEAVPVRRAVLDTETPLRDAPSPDAAAIATLPSGAEVDVVGRFNGHLYVRHGGRDAWVPAPAAP